MNGIDVSTDDEQPDDTLGWDIDQHGRMRDFADMPIEHDIEMYSPRKDPVNKGLTFGDGRVRE